MSEGLPIRWTCVLAGVAGIIGVLMIGYSFGINNGPPLTAPDSVFLSYVSSHRHAVLVASWLQAVGPALIICLAVSLVALAGAFRRVSGLLTVFGAGVLMTASLLEIVCYIGQLFVLPADMPRIANTLGYAVQHLYFFVAAPALFAPLGIVLVRSRILPRIFGWLALVLAGIFFALGVATLDQLVLPAPITAFAAAQALWWFAAGITLIIRSKAIASLIEARI
jgi:hypothetical protein